MRERLITGELPAKFRAAVDEVLEEAGGCVPGSSTISGSTTVNEAFQSFAYYSGDSTGSSSLDEIKLGDTYAIVTR